MTINKVMLAENTILLIEDIHWTKSDTTTEAFQI